MHFVMSLAVALQLRFTVLGAMVPLEQIEYGVYGDLIIISPRPYSIYLRGTIFPGATLSITIPIMENQMEKIMAHEMETGVIRGSTGIQVTKSTYIGL